ncbi:MAG: bifunctional DNA-formamidopyrimidine glycosylase/DNA-(apurinic or apyrimidinic site) lyase [Alphaproteobacteria bacterium]|nr:bifunctional DNA-formamidopyrimidine glycosylase/DNA-(apurinic or apyrimidinic site) lyase [Alphaproteobacteria bacterium]
MPELPEVESVRKSLSLCLPNKTIQSITMHYPKIIIYPPLRVKTVSKNITSDFCQMFQNEIFKTIHRRAKNLIFEFYSGKTILAHLKMTGQFLFYNDLQHLVEDKHTHLIFNLNQGFLVYRDVRKFGYLIGFKSLEACYNHACFEKIGLEPFDKKFTLKYLKQQLSNTNSVLKSVLLQQKFVVGCGNIYCDEICFKSKVLPNRKCNTLLDFEIEAIYKNIKQILQKAIDFNGTSFSDYVNSDGQRGEFIAFLKVYGKHGQPCPTCQHTLQKTTINTRTTTFCEYCQK